MLLNPSFSDLETHVSVVLQVIDLVEGGSDSFEFVLEKEVG
jgi:hypothetical protein